MAAYDRLPAPLRAWMRSAALPWSAQSCHRIWSAARRAGLSLDARLARLDAAEQKTLRQAPGLGSSNGRFCGKTNVCERRK
ncbi:MAG: hypothetical protein BM562_14805 [Alphaproteobacteria bacterium MedPE-SWcel]|nr:MAG: hypothetical protein BM562_14805 [Alphaproteobacteria bacterium MedPE-SWcel]